MPDETTQPAAGETPAETPHWTKSTPTSESYELCMFESNGGEAIEDIFMTRHEYILLKRYLARLQDVPFDLKDHDKELAEDDLGYRHAEYLLPGDLLADLSEADVIHLNWFADILRADRGTYTPAEAFLSNLVLHHSAHPLTPAKAAEELADFKELFEDTLDRAKLFIQQYPKEYAEKAEATQ